MTNIAKTRKQLEQAQNQILSIINDSIPVSTIIKDLDVYNKNGVTLVNLRYSDPEAEDSSQVTLRAKTISRIETENFVDDLEKTDLYSLVVSPLSNLVGKGERFVNLTLIINKDNVIKVFNEEITEQDIPNE